MFKKDYLPHDIAKIIYIKEEGTKEVKKSKKK